MCVHACAMMMNTVGTRAEAPVPEHNHNCSPILSAASTHTVSLAHLNKVPCSILSQLAGLLLRLWRSLVHLSTDESVQQFKVKLQRCIRMLLSAAPKRHHIDLSFVSSYVVWLSESQQVPM